MTTIQGDRSPPRRRPGPKPRGRTVVPLTITVTHAQRAGLEARADMEKSSISTVVRRFVAAGLAASGLFALSALIEIAIVRRRLPAHNEPGAMPVAAPAAESMAREAC
ncbi:MAG: hypothetical protein M3Y58_04625 [Chloroflexota bacterium]|nr:hypothetical protein [Chloroflexota bacterium]